MIGIAACGLTPFVHGAVAGPRRGAATGFVTCAPEVARSIRADFVINPVVGPEVVTGSTRMKAGTATKLVLNTITTGAMIRIGKVYGNLMVDLRATNAKLRNRAERIVIAAASAPGKKITRAAPASSWPPPAEAPSSPSSCTFAPQAPLRPESSSKRPAAHSEKPAVRVARHDQCVRHLWGFRNPQRRERRRPRRAKRRKGAGLSRGLSPKLVWAVLVLAPGAVGAAMSAWVRPNDLAVTWFQRRIVDLFGATLDGARGLEWGLIRFAAAMGTLAVLRVAYAYARPAVSQATGPIASGSAQTFSAWRMFVVATLGFASGLPMALTGTAMQGWAGRQGFNVAQIGWLGLAALPYSLKFLWSPLMDRFVPPFLGRRRGWILVCQLALIVVILGMAAGGFGRGLPVAAVLLTLIAFCSASQEHRHRRVPDRFADADGNRRRLGRRRHGLARASFVPGPSPSCSPAGLAGKPSTPSWPGAWP